MVVNQQVKKVSDLMYMIVPGTCPEDTPGLCDSCAHSLVNFEPRGSSRRPGVKIGYVSCRYPGIMRGVVSQEAAVNTPPSPDMI